MSRIELVWSTAFTFKRLGENRLLNVSMDIFCMDIGDLLDGFIPILTLFCTLELRGTRTLRRF